MESGSKAHRRSAPWHASWGRRAALVTSLLGCLWTMPAAADQRQWSLALTGPNLLMNYGTPCRTEEPDLVSCGKTRAFLMLRADLDIQLRDWLVIAPLLSAGWGEETAFIGNDGNTTTRRHWPFRAGVTARAFFAPRAALWIEVGPSLSALMILDTLRTEEVATQLSRTDREPRTGLLAGVESLVEWQAAPGFGVGLRVGVHCGFFGQPDDESIGERYGVRAWGEAGLALRIHVPTVVQP